MFWDRLRRRKRDEELDDELAAHLRMASDDRISRGESPLDAARNARREFGNALLIRETTRDMWAWGAWERLAQDVKFTLRQLRRNKGFAAIAVLTLALGIGVNTAIFTLVHAVMFNSLPVDQPGELYRLGKGDNCCEMTGYQNGQDFSLFSFELYKTLREGTPEIRHMAAFQASPTVVNMRRAGGADAGRAFISEFVSSNYFDLFGIRPALGGFFVAQDDVRGSAPKLVLSYRAWHTYLGGDPAIIGASLLIKGKPFTVVGVAPSAFYGETLRSDTPDCWLPVATEPLVAGSNSLFNRPAKEWLYVMGRIPASVPRAPLEAKINGEAKRWFYAQAGPQISTRNRSRLEDQFIPITSASGGVDIMSLQYRSGLVLLMSLSSLVLLIACANVANLLLARGTAMRAQNSLKLALGASRARMTRQALTDSLMLALLGGAVGLAFAFGATRLILQLAFQGSRHLPISSTPSFGILGFAFAVSVATGLLFGIAPAWLDARSDPADALRGATRSTPSAAMRPQKVLVVVQAALSFILLTGAALLTQSLWNLEHQHFGFTTDQRILVKLNPAVKDYTAERLAATYRLVDQRLSQIPGVLHTGLAMYAPMTATNWNDYVYMEGGGQAPLPGDVSYDRVSPAYFDSIGTRLLQGRGIAPSDGLSSRRVAVVSQTFVDRYLKNRSPIGVRFGTDGPEHAADYEIVGVVEDTKYDRADRPPAPTFFMPLFQPELNNDGTLSTDDFAGAITLHVAAGAAGLEPLIRKTILDVDPNLGVLDVKSYSDELALRFSQQRLLATLTQLFGLLALALASIGLYGLVALSVARRTAEIGVRIALGATRGSVVRMVLKGAVIQVALGVAAGLLITMAGARIIQHQLFGVSTANPVTMAGATVLLIACAALAALLPASRAAAVDPIRALRTE
jgi:macrolide transport system ATP-binding/permease protein